MDAFRTRPKNRLALEPTQRRVRHIRVVFGRNLTFTPCDQQRSLASVLSPPAQLAQTSNYPHSIHSGAHSRSMTPSAADLASMTSSSSKNYFRSPWRSQYYTGGGNSERRLRSGPGSDTGSITSAVSESGRRSRVREPIARLSASFKATVLSSTDLTGRRSMDVPVPSSSSSSLTPATPTAAKNLDPNTRWGIDAPSALIKHRSTIATHESLSSQRRAQTPEPRLKATLPLRDRAHERDDVPPRISLPNSPTLSSSNTISDPGQPTDILRNSQPAPISQSNGDPVATSTASSARRNTGRTTPPPPNPSSSRTEHTIRPQLFDSYFTLHDYEDDAVIYTSEVIKQSNNPRFRALEDQDITDKAKRRLGRLTIRMWACVQGLDFSPLLEWKLELCCLRYIGQELHDIPGSLPENTIIIGLEDGFYTAPDEDDMPEHPHPAPLPAHDPLDRHLQQQAGKRSYNYESVMRLNNLHECIADTEKSRDEIKQNIELSLKSANAQLLLQKVKGERTERLWHLQRQIGHELNMLEQAQDQVEYLKKQSMDRKEALAEARERGRTQETYLIESHGNLLRSRGSLYDVLREQASRRRDLLTILLSIYPITESEDDPSLLRILNVPLPNSSFNGAEDETVAIALGFTCQLVTLLGHYLSVPLRYPLTPMGSRSTVSDPISMLVGPKEFPLYRKGQDRNRFEYGVFLMNKDIEQLLNSQGLQFLDLRQTLPNIRYLLESLLTSSPVQSVLYRSKFKSRQRQEDKLHHRYSLEGSCATETDDELGAPVLRVQSPDEHLGKPRIDFDAPRTPSSATDTSLSAKTSGSQSPSQPQNQVDVGEGYTFVDAAARFDGNDQEDVSWQAPQPSSTFFSVVTTLTDDTLTKRASRLHRASADFGTLDGRYRLAGEEEGSITPRPRHTSWGPHDARHSNSYSGLFGERHKEGPPRHPSSSPGYGDGGGQGSDSSDTTAHESGHVHQNSFGSLTPASSAKTMSSEVPASLDAVGLKTRSVTRVAL